MNTLRRARAFACGSPEEREALRLRNEDVRSASDCAPGWLQITSAWALAALTTWTSAAIRPGRWPRRWRLLMLMCTTWRMRWNASPRCERFANLSNFFTSDDLAAVADLLEACRGHRRPRCKRTSPACWRPHGAPRYPGARGGRACGSARPRPVAGEVDEGLIAEACLAAADVGRYGTARRPPHPQSERKDGEMATRARPTRPKQQITEVEGRSRGAATRSRPIRLSAPSSAGRHPPARWAMKRARRGAREDAFEGRRVGV